MVRAQAWIEIEGVGWENGAKKERLLIMCQDGRLTESFRDDVKQEVKEKKKLDRVWRSQWERSRHNVMPATPKVASPVKRRAIAWSRSSFVLGDSLVFFF